MKQFQKSTTTYWTRTFGHQVSISPTYLRKTFTHEYPKSAKIKSSIQYLFALLGSSQLKSALKTLGEMIPLVDFTNMLTCSFYACRSQKHLVKLRPGVNFINVLLPAFARADPKNVKNTDNLTVFFYTFRIYECKSCM